MGLFTPSWKGKDEKKALAYIEECKNQKKLAQIARENSKGKAWWSRRYAALKKLTDQEELYKIVMEGCFIDLGTDIIFSRLTDQKLLVDVAWESKNRIYRVTAVERLTDRKVLEELAQKSDIPDVRIMAIKKLENQDILSIVALGDAVKDVRTAAVARLTAQDTLATVALTDEDYKIRDAAASKLTDQEVLLKIASSDKNAVVRETARERITDGEKQIALVLALKEMIFPEKGVVLSNSEWAEIVRGLTLEDLKGRTLHKELVYKLYNFRSDDFVYDALIQAGDEELLLNILSDISAEAYKKNHYTCEEAMKLLHGLYQRGAFRKEIETKRGEELRPHYDNMACMGHDDYGAVVFYP